MISNDDIARFQSDGALCIRRLLSPDQVDVLREGIDLNLGDLSPRAKVASAVNDPGRFVEDFCNWQDNPHYRRIIFETALAEAAGRLMRSGARASPRPGIRISRTTTSRAGRTSASGFPSIR